MDKRNVVLYAAVIILAVFSYGTGLLSTVDYWLQDKWYQRLSVVSPDIYVIGIDEETLEELGPFQTWSRKATAELISLLTEEKDTAPAVIGVDIGFYGEADSEDDKRLTEAVKKAGNVVLSSYASFGGRVVDNADRFYVQEVTKSLEQPFPELKEAAVSTGHTNVRPDEDGIIRRSLQQVSFEGETDNSFSYEIYHAYTGNDVQPPLDKNNQWYIPFSGKPMDYYGAQGQGSSFIRVLNGEFPKEIFAGSIVLIGPYTSGMMDAYYTSVSRDVQMYGVEIHANVVQALMEENFKQDVPVYVNLLILLVLCTLMAYLTKKLDFRIAGLLAVLMTGAFLGGCMLAYQKGWIVSIVYAVLFLWLVYIEGCFYQYWKERRERRKMMEIYSRYLSPQVAKNIAVKGESATQLGGKKKDIAVLFVDIRNFTTISETLAPEQVVGFLNSYLDLTTKSIFQNEGTVDKFIGDATMAVFNAPFDLDDYVYKAVKTGLDMVKGAKALEDKLVLETGYQISFGIGIHCGEAIVGNIGASFRMEYTAIGDTVNTASRLEGQAQRGEIIISQEIVNRLEGRIETEYLGKRKLKGKSENIDIYKVVDLK